MTDISWPLVLALASTGIAMALLSCLLGMRPKLENPLWWALYLVWIVVVVASGNQAPFRTLLISSAFAGLLHGTTSALLLDRYLRNNPWHADHMQGPRPKLALRFLATGVVVGIVFGAVIGGIGWGVSRLLGG